MSSDNLFSREAEEAVVGSVLINPVAFTTLGLEPGQRSHGPVSGHLLRLLRALRGVGHARGTEAAPVAADRSRRGSTGRNLRSRYGLRLLGLPDSDRHRGATPAAHHRGPVSCRGGHRGRLLDRPRELWN